MRKFKNSAKGGNYPILERNTMPSETVPDQAMSVQEILIRFANGTMPNIMHESVFSEDLPDLRGLDISEIMNMKREATEEITYYETELKNRQRETQLSKFSKKTENTEKQPETPKTP